MTIFHANPQLPARQVEERNGMPWQDPVKIICSVAAAATAMVLVQKEANSKANMA